MKNSNAIFDDSFDCPIIRRTTNYEIFKRIDANRSVNHYSRIIESFKKIDLSRYCPVIVTKDYYVIDGQNRIMACKELHLPVYYIQIENKVDNNLAMECLNRNQTQWSLYDYLHHFATVKGNYQGKYILLTEIIHKYPNLNLTALFVILFSYNGNHKIVKLFKKGIIQNDVNECYQKIIEFLFTENLKLIRFRFTRNFLIAIMNLVNNYGLEKLKKLEKKIIVVPQCAKVSQYMECFKKICKINNK